MVETKLRRNSQVRREVVGQVLEYGAYLSQWSADDVERQAEHYLADPKTPARFRSQSPYEALSRLGTLESPAEGVDENDIRGKISNSIANFDMRLIIAVDRVLDPLRSLVTFTNSASRFAMYLLEVQQYLAPDGLRIASINVYGGSGPRPDGGGDGRTRWDETRFSDTLKDHTPADARAAVQELYAFMQEQADSVVWGTGRVDGSAGFGVRRGGDRFVIFWVTTKGRVYFSAASLNKRAQQEARALLSTLRALGIEAPDELLEGDHWPTFDAGRLKNSSDRKRFRSAVLAIRDAVTH